MTLRMKNRRRMALISFGTIIAGIGMCFYVVMFGDDSADDKLLAATGLLTMLFGCLTSIVLTYMGISTYDDQQERKKSE